MSAGPDGSEFDRTRYEQELADLHHVLDTAEVVGWPRREAELIELRRLVGKYPDEARKILNEADEIHDADRHCRPTDDRQ